MGRFTISCANGELPFASLHRAAAPESVFVFLRGSRFRTVLCCVLRQAEPAPAPWRSAPAEGRVSSSH